MIQPCKSCKSLIAKRKSKPFRSYSTLFIKLTISSKCKVEDFPFNLPQCHKRYNLANDLAN